MTLSRLSRIARQRVRTLVRRQAIERELERELAFHLEALRREQCAAGLDEREARLAARRAFGNVAALADRSRDARGLSWTTDLAQDIRHACRTLAGSPGFATIAAVALALGIGAAAAVAAALAFVAVRPLPFPDADRLVAIRTAEGRPPGPPGGASVREYADWRDRNETLEAIGASLSSPRDLAAESTAMPADRVAGQSFTPSLFATLGAAPSRGRLFADTDDPFSPAALVAVISHRLWERRFDSRPDILGRPIVVDGVRRTIVGVMDPGFRYQADNVEIWTPLVFAPRGSPPPRFEARLLLVAARLRPGITLARARADLEAIAGKPASGGSSEPVRLSPLRDTLYGWTRSRLHTLAAVVALMLVLACANVAGLLLARSATRRRELAIRLALGATRARLVRQLVTESLVLGLIAGVLAVGVAAAGLFAVNAALGPPPGLPHLGELRLDGWVLTAILLLSVGASLGFGLVPALTESRLASVPPLGAPRPIPPLGTAAERWRGALVAAQVALAEVLLIAATLLAISYVRLAGRDLQFEPAKLLSFTYALPAARFARPLAAENGVPAFQVSEMASQTIRQVHQALQMLPGAGPVAGISYPPVNSLILPLLPVTAPDSGPSGACRADPTAYFVVTPGIFATLRTPLLGGREFVEQDDHDAPWGVVVNEALAARCWPGQAPVGRRLRIEAGREEPERIVIGVVGNVPARLDERQPRPVMYASYRQQPAHYRGPAVGMFGGMAFVMRPTGPASRVLADARAAVAAITPDRPIVEVGTVDAHRLGRLGEHRAYVLTTGVFALSALLLAMVGLFGLVGQTVNARAGEVAVRIALGAQPGPLLALLIGPAARLVAAGLVAGTVLAAGSTPWLRPQLWRVAATDPTAFAGVSILLVAAAILACLAPLRQALRVDPAIRLRAE